MKLTLIGNGNMALSLAKGLCESYELEIIGRDLINLEQFKKEVPQVVVKVLQDNENIRGKNILLCVKPYVLSEIAARLQGEANTLYSILAGTTIESLKSQIQAESYVRTMPNLGASYHASMTTLTGDENAKNKAIEIFNSIGTTLWVKTQKELDIATAIAGSGPAYLALIAEALSDGGVRCGLTRSDSQTLVKGLFSGFAPLIQNNQASAIKDGVMSPGGTTAAGYAMLEENGVRTAMIQTVAAAFKQAIKLGKK
ncbi:MAG: pyrroline-5-carboxylate reductase [Campylobacterota bacterium]|nr:pyrroline-5-carboxylate reductase [Campylobacterota bacterium]